MAGAFALGDFGWAYENLLNHVLSGQLPANDRVAGQILKAIQELEARLAFFQTAQAADAAVDSMVAVAEAIVAGEDDVTPVFQPALMPESTPANTSKIIAPEGWLLDEGEAVSPETDAWMHSDEDTVMEAGSISADTTDTDEAEAWALGDEDAVMESGSISIDTEAGETEAWMLSDDAEESGNPIEPEAWMASDDAEESVNLTESEAWMVSDDGGAEPETAATEDWLQSEEAVAPVELEGSLQPEPELQFLHMDESVAAIDAAAEEDADTQLIWQLFWEEVPDQLQALDQNLQRLMDDPSDQEAIRELEREFHTLKGGARMAQLTELADISHESESLLNRLSGSGSADSVVLETLQTSIDTLHSLAEIYQQRGRTATLSLSAVEEAVAQPSVVATPESTAVAQPEKPVAENNAFVVLDEQDEAPLQDESLADSWAKRRSDQGEFTSLLERMLAEQAESLPDISVLGISARTETSLSKAEPEEFGNQVKNHETIRLPAVFIDHLIERAVGLNVQQIRMSEYFNSMGSDVAELGRTVARLRQQIRTLELETEAQIHDGRGGAFISPTGKSDGFDPLEMDQYAELQRVSRSLAESLNDLVNLEADLSGQLRKGEQLLQEDMRTTRQIQQDLLETRLVALTMLVPRLRRLTRQTATELGKQVTLEVQGEDCELDRNLLQHMTAPLEHLIRNAISHGLETPEAREQAGKSATGQVTLSVSRDDAEIVMSFRDDGRGLNREKLLKRGRELGFIQPGQTLPDNELDRLILRTGFSTADTVSQIAGRGIGMDVVHSELKALGGSLQIESTPGQGTEFIMRLPFTMVVNPVLLAEVHGQIFALPMTGIQGLARLPGDKINKLLESTDSRLEFAEQHYAVRQLAEQLGAGAIHEFIADEMFPVVFYSLHGQSIAWVIERIKGRREVVLQPLGVLFNECRLYSAATVSPDGSVFLVADMAELARRVVQEGQELAETVVEEIAETQPEEPAGPPRIMVVDDSITVRRVTEKFLNAKEYVVATAKDGMEALERIAEFRPDAVLLDIEMPRMDGFELLGHLRRDPQWSNLPIIMISSRTAQKHREHALSLGATSFLGKPYQNEILLDTLQHVLSTGHKLHGESVSA